MEQGFQSNSALDLVIAAGTDNENNNELQYNQEEHVLPLASILRIMRRLLPRDATITQETKDAIQKCASEFISFVTSEANDHCHSEQRKIISAEDVIFALTKLGFEDYVQPLAIYLRRYRQSEAVENNNLPPPPARPVFTNTSTPQFVHPTASYYYGYTPQPGSIAGDGAGLYFNAAYPMTGGGSSSGGAGPSFSAADLMPGGGSSSSSGGVGPSFSAADLIPGGGSSSSSGGVGPSINAANHGQPAVRGGVRRARRGRLPGPVGGQPGGSGGAAGGGYPHGRQFM